MSTLKWSLKTDADGLGFLRMAGKFEMTCPFYYLNKLKVVQVHLEIRKGLVLGVEQLGFELL